MSLQYGKYHHSYQDHLLHCIVILLIPIRGCSLHSGCICCSTGRILHQDGESLRDIYEFVLDHSYNLKYSPPVDAAVKRKQRSSADLK